MAKIGYYVGKTKNPLTGEEGYVARMANYSTLGTEDILDYAVQNAQVSRNTLAVGMAALTDAIHNFVLNGHSVTLDGLGCIQLTAQTGIWNSKFKKWTSAGKTSMDDVSAEDIKGLYMRFRPCKALRAQLESIEYFDSMNTQFALNKAGKTKAYKKLTTNSNNG